MRILTRRGSFTALGSVIGNLGLLANAGLFDHGTFPAPTSFGNYRFSIAGYDKIKVGSGTDWNDPKGPHAAPPADREGSPSKV